MFKLGLACVRVRLVPLRPLSTRTCFLPRPVHRRTASFFPWSNPPSLDTAARIAALEARANAHPDDLSNQLAFLNALIATRTKEGYDTVIDRWEHASERVRSLFSLVHPAHHFPEPLLSPPPLRRRL